MKSGGALLACMGLASMDSMAWSRRARGDESSLREALGLPVDAPAEEVMAATPAQLDAIDMDLMDFWEWKRERCPKTAAVSLEYAEAWRLRQTMALAAAIVDEVMEPRPTRSPPHLSPALQAAVAWPAGKPARPAPQQLGLVW